jgi:NhaP-type Na+/H+ or K+/H+ antiporter
LILAGPGVVMTALALAWFLKSVLGYVELGFAEALVIGSVIATTDPVAVVALLKELGASTRFRTMIEGESLLNDGTAFVFFLICMDVVKSGSLHYGTAIV